jgi:hypothetical protein
VFHRNPRSSWAFHHGLLLGIRSMPSCSWLWFFLVNKDIKRKSTILFWTQNSIAEGIQSYRGGQLIQHLLDAILIVSARKGSDRTSSIPCYVSCGYSRRWEDWLDLEMTNNCRTGWMT